MDFMLNTAPPSPKVRGYADIEPEAAWAKSQAGVLIVDVREVHEFDGELGHVPGATLHPLHEWPTVVLEMDKRQPIVLVCRSGGRSGRAAEILLANGFQKVFNMAGGMLAWGERGLPVARGQE